MFRYFIRRILLAIPILLLVYTLVFVVVRVIPGDPAEAALGDYASKEAVEALRERMGLNRAMFLDIQALMEGDILGVFDSQYFTFLFAMLRGDFGESLISGVSISEQISYVLPYTLQLTAAAVLIGVILGVPLGLFTAMNRNNIIDYIGRIVSLVGLSVPAFYLGILLILVFAVELDLFPAIGGGYIQEDPLGSLKYLVLPAMTLGLIMTTSVTRLTRSAMLNVLSEDYVRTARSKGLAERVVILKHALRAALLPIVSITGFWVAVLIGDSVLTEVVFSRPGLGKMLVGAINQRDYSALQSIMVIYAAFVVVVNLLTDLTYGFLDPRITR